MFRKRLILASYPLVYLGLALFLRFVVWLHFKSGIENTLIKVALVKVALVLGALFTLVGSFFLLDNSYYNELLEVLPKEVKRRCGVYFSYLDRVSLILFLGFGVSIFLGESFYSHLTGIFLYFALGLYLSSSAVILLFTNRK